MKPRDLKCRPQVAAVIGEAYADYELQLVIDCEECYVNEGEEKIFDSFAWSESPQKNDFWSLICDGKNPYEHGHEKPRLKEWIYYEGEWLYRDNDYYTDENGCCTMHISEVNGVGIPRYTGEVNPNNAHKSKAAGKIGARLVPEEEKSICKMAEDAFKKAEAREFDKERSKVTAASILEAGLGHMQDRAVTYDNPQGERSMGKTVDMFNVLYGLEITEEQGWAFMTILKLVRTSQGEFKLDNFEDMAAYAGLMGEAASEKPKV